MSSTIKIKIDKLTPAGLNSEEDLLAIEEPLEIRISYFKNNNRKEYNLSITMRTPGEDSELALGFLFTEGIIDSMDQVLSINSFSENTITIAFTENVIFDIKKLEKHFYTSSSCGICGKTSIEAIRTIKSSTTNNKTLIVNSTVIQNLPSALRRKQNIFEQTGGLHASAIFNPEGELILLCEDVGRHNALDKLIGSALKTNILPLEQYILLLSGRASFELIQKATMAGITIVASIGAPSSLAVELANEREMTLIGFLRNKQFNIYCGKERIKLKDSELKTA